MKIYLIAVEPSADQLGADLAKALRLAHPEVHLAGIGGAKMRSVGIPSQMEIDGLAILGITEALKKLPHVYRKITEAADRIETAQPDAVVFLDSYGFMIRLAERLRKRGFDKTLIKYVAPQVWAMRPSRAKRVARLFDGLLTLHPFEADYFTPLGLPTHYVGNAVFDTDYLSGDADAIRKQYKLENRPILSVFFGSRKSEVDRLSRSFADAVMSLKKAIPDLAIISPVSDSVAEDVGAAAGADPRLNEIIFLPETAKLDVMACSTAALACSGTVTTQLACAGVPTVVAYRLSALSHAIVSPMLTLDYISMVNISAEDALMPEFLQGQVTGEAMSSALMPYLTDTKKRATVSNALIAQTNQMRGPKHMTASAKAAQAIIEILT
ncbi:MAG: lipid-A-disaccharide synthase [Litorimonas sp.]